MKPVYVPNLYVVGTVLSATRNSAAQQLYNSFVYAIQVVITGTPTGSLKLQASCDQAYSGKPTSGSSGLNPLPVNWTDIASSSQAVTAAGSVIWNITDPGYNWVRIVYTDTSSGSSTAVIASSSFNGKGF